MVSLYRSEADLETMLTDLERQLLQWQHLRAKWTAMQCLISEINSVRWLLGRDEIPQDYS